MDQKVADVFGNESRPIQWQAPVHFNLVSTDDQQKLLQLKEQIKGIQVIDHIHLALAELFDIEHPDQKDSKTDEQVKAFANSITKGNPDSYGEWIYFPWSNELVHFPPKEAYHLLKTARNRNLVTAEEQTKLYQSTVAIFGLSVGSNVAEAVVSQGIGGKLILVDMDILEPTNLNRIRAAYKDVGQHKVDVIAKKISELDPFIEQVHYRDGLNAENLKEIIDSHQPSMLIDEMDDVRMKLKLRITAKQYKLPVIMAADDGDNILLDIERYDQNPDYPILHNKVPPEVIEQILDETHELPRPQLGMLIGKYFVGFENTPVRMFESLGEVGKSLPSWPQLGGAAALAGITLAFCTKRIILNLPLAEGRFVVGPDEQLNPEIHTDAYKVKHQHFVELINGMMKSQG